VAVYVDDAEIPATVRNGSRVHASTWCHLTADTEEELHAFAKKLGLRRSWYQGPDEHGDLWHYDLTTGKRQRALQLGAQPVSVRQIVEKARSRTRPSRHTWRAAGNTQQCATCHLIAVGRVRDSAGRWHSVWQARDIQVISSKTPECGRALRAASPAERARLATEADQAAHAAFLAGDLGKAADMITLARVLDSTRAAEWSQREAGIRRASRASESSDRLPLAELLNQRLATAGIAADDPAIMAWARWNGAVQNRDSLEEG
jgi:hypothetical protein